MAKIAITDLAESLELDREAMSVIFGGARTPRPRQSPTSSAPRGPRPESKTLLLDQARAKRRGGFS